jgi:phytoene/squalene synthetase
VRQAASASAERKRDRDFSLMPWLLPAPIRPDVRALGRFARLVDAIAATSRSSVVARQERLRACEAMLEEDYAPVDVPRPGDTDGVLDAVMVDLRASLARSGMTARYARGMLQTVREALQDAEDRSSADGRSAVVHASWADLLAYCNGVASPIGRQMLALCGEDLITCGPPADALCTAMRILKELRDFDGLMDKSDVRLCIPESFMRDASISLHHLQAASARGQTRAVLDRILDGVDAQLATAEALPGLIRSRRLRIYVAVVLCRARKLAATFRRRDPFQEKVELSLWQRTVCLWLGLVRAA